MDRTAQSFMVGIVIIAALFVLTNPNSQGPSLIGNVANGLVNLIQAATGQALTGQAATTTAKKTTASKTG